MTGFTAIRKCVPLAEWPVDDQKAWTVATTEPDIFTGGGAAHNWKTKTKATVIKAYGRWLAYARDQGWLANRKSSVSLVTKANIRAYFRVLQAEVTAVTVAGRLRDLAEAMRVMYPKIDCRWLAASARKLTSRAQPTRQKIAEIVPLRTLYTLGLELMASAGNGARPAWRASRYRQGLMIALLAAYPMRRANFVALEIGSTFVAQGQAYSVRLPAKDTKGGRSALVTFPEILTPSIDTYLTQHRPLLLKGRRSDKLWISWEGKDLSEAGFYEELRKVTKCHFGIAIPPHRFRDIMTTSVALEDPKYFGITQPILQHRNERTTLTAYNQARQFDAVRKLQRTVIKMRRGG